jgi:hypothetical protein
MTEWLPEATRWVGAAAGAGLSAKLAWNVLGPASNALGRRLEASIDAFHLERIVRVVKNAASKVPELESTAGQVPGRLLGRIIDETEWVDDEVIVEYLGGILASSRSPDGRDDRGVAWTSLVRDLSAYTLRMHYTVYTIARRLLPGRVDSVTDGTKLQGGTLFIPDDVLLAAMDVGQQEIADHIMSHCVFALHSRSLLADGFAHADDPQFLQMHGVPHAKVGGLLAPLTATGVELYMWAHGHGALNLDRFLDQSLVFEYPPDIEIPEGAQLLGDMSAIEVNSED